MSRTFEDHLQQYGEFICKALVDYPEDVKFLVAPKAEHIHCYIWNYMSCDKGHLLGRDQRIFVAFRTLLQSFGKTVNQAIQLTLDEPISTKPARPHPLKVGDEWSIKDDRAISLFTSKVMSCVHHPNGQRVIRQQLKDKTILTIHSDALDSQLFTAVNVIVKAAARMRGRVVDINLKPS